MFELVRAWNVVVFFLWRIYIWCKWFVVLLGFECFGYLARKWPLGQLCAAAPRRAGNGVSLWCVLITTQHHSRVAVVVAALFSFHLQGYRGWVYDCGAAAYRVMMGHIKRGHLEINWFIFMIEHIMELPFFVCFFFFVSKLVFENFLYVTCELCLVGCMHFIL